MSKQHTLKLGVSLSTKLCDELRINPIELLQQTTDNLGITRFRLMTYWDEYEPNKGEYTFERLDKIIAHITKIGGETSLCVGMRQPRWPECHVPDWAKELDKNDRDAALLAFMRVVVKRYKNNTAITSWQLENEAYNKGIGECADYDRSRIVREFELIKKLDHLRPVIMTTSNNWVIPFRSPRPDIVGVSLYLHQWGRRGLSKRHLPALYHKVRNWLIAELLRVGVFCHELQMEPWGERATQELNNIDQKHLMPVEGLENHLEYARRTGCSVVDMWGLEWWYWRKAFRNDVSYWQEMQRLVANYTSEN